MQGPGKDRLGTALPLGRPNLAEERTSLERLSEIAERTGALAAVNGGYFVIGPADGTPGDFAGISVLGGDLVKEAVNVLPGGGRGALVRLWAPGPWRRV